jgi:predicted RNA binding protein YcfA (HicA-like mRNA interferase family)
MPAWRPSRSMPKLPRDVSPARLVGFLLRRGWCIAREGARHTILVHDGRELAVPRHGPLKTGTLAAALKQAGVSRDEWDRV